MRRVASIDIGTNSTRLLVAEYRDKHLNRIETDLVTTRLGRGMGAGRLLPETMRHTAEAIGRFYQKALDLGAKAIIAAATSAVRDASNSGDFLELVKRKTGLTVRVLSGAEEAALSWRGVISGLPVEPGSTLVIDIGGGSTEFIRMQGKRLSLASVNAGAVRFTAAKAGTAAMYEVLEPVLIRLKQQAPRSLIGVGGTITTLAAVDQQLSPYDPERVHGYRLTRRSVQRILSILSSMGIEERKKVKGLPPPRADIIVAGVQIAGMIMENLGLSDMLVSECDILYGLALEEIERK